MKIGDQNVDELLSGYFSGGMSENDKTLVDKWRMELPENEFYFHEYLKAWEAMSLLNEMEQFNSFEALKRVNSRLSETKPIAFWQRIQRVAAILLLPLMVYSGYVTYKNQPNSQNSEQEIMQTISSRQGMVTQFLLADGTKVWLNSCSQLQFPTHFSGDKREVILKGEAFFEVTKNEKQPFRVNANDLKVDVLGTSFNVVNFDDDKQSEVVLVNGKVTLASEYGHTKNPLGMMHPGQRSVYEKDKRLISTEAVDVDKYIAWRDGNLIFRDDAMEDVVKRLSRWFNVEIVVNDPELNNYIYKATFKNENLVQVLNLLKLSAPIDYRVTDRKLLPDGNFTKQKVFLMKKRS